MMSRLTNPIEHDDLLNYRLKRLVAVGGAPAVRLCEGRYGVTRQEWRVLAALVEGGAMTPSALAERSFLQRAIVSRKIAVLIGKRLAQRIKGADASGRIEVDATPAGRELYAELFPQLAEINRRLMAVLDEREAQLFEALLDKLWEHARRLHDDVDARADRRHGGSRRQWERDGQG